MSRRYPDEVEVAAHRHPTQDDLGELFAPLAPPKRPVVSHAEQRALLPPPGTIEADYAAWRLTESGRFCFAKILARALDQARAGAKRLSAKALVEWCRGNYLVEINNSHTALLARELFDAKPELRRLLELRQRSAP